MISFSLLELPPLSPEEEDEKEEEVNEFPIGNQTNSSKSFDKQRSDILFLIQRHHDSQETYIKVFINDRDF